MNWDDARVLIAISRDGSLRAAGRNLGMDQATVGRRLATLEHVLGAKLFLRTSAGYVLTAWGEVALASAIAMESHALELQRRIHGLDNKLQGTVRITSTDSVAQDFVIPAVASLHRKHPEVSVQLQSSTTFLCLVKRETDIAIRNVKPENPDLIARRLVVWPVGLYASQEYLTRKGEPQRGKAFAGHDLVVYQPYMDNDKDFRLVGEPITAGRVAASVSSSQMVRCAVLSGIGMGELPEGLAAGHELIRVWPERTSPKPYTMWLVTHADLRQTARVKATIEELINFFKSE